MSDPSEDFKRLPRNAGPIPFPFNNTHMSPPFEDFVVGSGSLPTASPSVYSEFNVVLDDGSLQKRRVSLSTLPDDLNLVGLDEEEFEQEEQQREDDDDMIDDLLVQYNIPAQQSNDRKTSSQETLGTSSATPLLQDQKKKSYASITSQPPSLLHHDVDSYTTSTEEMDDSDNSSFTNTFKKARYRKLPDASFLPPPPPESFRHRIVTFCFNQIIKFHLTPQQCMVMKCSFAYILGCLFTFVPELNALIGNNRVSSHLIATTTVFFNPAKTLGGMVEAALYGWGYTLFALLVCIGSMITTDYFVDKNMVTVAHVISLGFWLTGATFLIAFFKAHWNKPPVATASSLCFIIIFIILVREGSANKGDFDTTRIQQISTAIATGTLITVSCCILFWPISASKKLKKDLEATLLSYKVLLKLLTKTFLLDDDLPEFKANGSLQNAIVSHRASFTSLQKSLGEAKLEIIWNGEIRGCTKEYDAVVKSMQRLAQSVGGLRSSCGLQFELMQSSSDQSSESCSLTTSRINKKFPSIKKKNGNNKETWNIKADHHRRKLEGEMKRQKQQHHQQTAAIADGQQQNTTSYINLPNHHSHHSISDEDEEEEDGTLIEFIHTIRQPLKSLAYTCKQTIFHLQVEFSDKPRTGPGNETLKNNLIKAIALFEVSQREAVKRLNRHRQRHHRNSKSNSWGEAYALREDVFLVYFFVFNMIEFANELICLVDSVQQLSIAQEKKRSVCALIYKSLLLLFQRNKQQKEEKSAAAKNKKVASSSSSSNHAFVPNERHKMDTLHTPLPKTKWRQMVIKVWQIFSLFKLQKVRYATKATIAVIILAVPAFLQSTGGWFHEWRMEWALITLMVVMTPTVGGTNLVAIYRIYSTTLGCFAATCLYLLFPGKMYLLILGTWLFSIPNFWIILHHNKHGKFGQFTLLAYNLVMLNKYNDSRDTNRIDVAHLALQRCVSIFVGVIFGLIATAYVWPYEARVELRKGLSDFLLKLAWLYQKLVSVYSENQQHPHHQGDGGGQVASSSSNEEVAISVIQQYSSSKKDSVVSIQRQKTSQIFTDLELGLQRTLLELTDLLRQTPNEPRLKGAFPVETYSKILASCQNITDKFASMRTVILKDEWFQDVQIDFILPVTQERREVVGNVLLYFYILASAMRLKTPLPPYLPPARKAWESLILRLRQLPIVQSKQLLEKSHVYLFYYAYVTVLEDIIRELDKLGENMTMLFGAIVPPQQWESLFDENWDVEDSMKMLDRRTVE